MNLQINGHVMTFGTRLMTEGIFSLVTNREKSG